MRRRWVYVNGEAYEYGDEPLSEVHHIMPDIEPFQSTDGAYITSRSQWKEHLKRTDTVEMGMSDMKHAQEQWGKRKLQFQDRLKASAEMVRDATAQAGEVKPFRRSGLNVEIANRLHGRPEPSRKELVKLTLDIAKRMKRG